MNPPTMREHYASAVERALTTEIEAERPEGPTSSAQHRQPASGSRVRVVLAFAIAAAIVVPAGLFALRAAPSVGGAAGGGVLSVATDPSFTWNPMGDYAGVEGRLHADRVGDRACFWVTPSKPSSVFGAGPFSLVFPAGYRATAALALRDADGTVIASRGDSVVVSTMPEPLQRDAAGCTSGTTVGALHVERTAGPPDSVFVAACRATDLRIEFDPQGTAMGAVQDPLLVTNTSVNDCALTGPIALEVDRAGRRSTAASVLPSQIQARADRVALRPGAQLLLHVTASPTGNGPVVRPYTAATWLRVNGHSIALDGRLPADATVHVSIRPEGIHQTTATSCSAGRRDAIAPFGCAIYRSVGGSGTTFDATGIQVFFRSASGVPQMSVFAGCNQHVGRLTLGERTMTADFHSGYTSLVGCNTDSENRNRAVTAYFSQPAEWRLDAASGTLTFRNGGGTLVLRD